MKEWLKEGRGRKLRKEEMLSAADPYQNSSLPYRALIWLTIVQLLYINKHADRKALLTALPFASSSPLLSYPPSPPLGAGSGARKSGSQCAKHTILPNRRFNRNSCEDTKSYVCIHSAGNTFSDTVLGGAWQCWVLTLPALIFVNRVTFPQLVK